jgi:hypothetical protein
MFVIHKTSHSVSVSVVFWHAKQFHQTKISRHKYNCSIIFRIVQQKPLKEPSKPIHSPDGSKNPFLLAQPQKRLKRTAGSKPVNCQRISLQIFIII